METEGTLILISFVLSITPGPNNLMLLASGINHGFMRTLPHMAGILTGMALMFAVIWQGLSFVVAQFPWGPRVVATVGGIYLLYLAWKIITSAGPAAGREGPGKPLHMVEAMVFQWLNPKAWVMTTTLVGLHAAEHQGWVGLAGLVLVFSAVCLPCISVWVLFGAQLGRILRQPVALRAANITMGVLLVATMVPVLLGQI